MVHEKRSESLEEAFRKHEEGSYRPHMGPSGAEFESYKGGGQERDKPSHKEPVQAFGESRSLEDVFSPGLAVKVAQYFLDTSDTTVDDYEDLSEYVEGHHGAIDPSEHNVPEVQDWIDEKVEEEEYADVITVLAAEELGDQRVGVLEYTDESDLREFDPEEALEDVEFL